MIGPGRLGLARFFCRAGGGIFRFFQGWFFEDVAQVHHKLGGALAVFLLEIKGRRGLVRRRVRTAAHCGKYDRLTGGGSRETKPRQ